MMNGDVQCYTCLSEMLASRETMDGFPLGEEKLTLNGTREHETSCACVFSFELIAFSL